jgi:arsenate reductase-like glutaredoxin family protein
VQHVFGMPASRQSLPNYKPADKRASRAELMKLCDEKGLESMFRRRGGNYARLGISEVLR